MKSIFKNFIVNNANKDIRVVNNFLSLGLVQITNYLLPLITFPYLVRTIGAEKFGSITYALTVMMYMITITDYGFNLSATRDIAINRGNREKLSKIFYTVTASRLLIFLILVLILSMLINIYSRFQNEKNLYMSGLFYVLGNLAIPIWFFQGLEKMKYITIINFIAKIIILGLIYLFIKGTDDYVYMFYIYGAANMVAGIIGIIIIIKFYKICVYLPSRKEIWKQLYNGWSIFLMNISTVIFNSSTIIILGLFVKDTELGWYSISEKIAFLVWQFLVVISQSIYPHLCRLAEQSHTALVQFVYRVSIFFGIIIFSICGLIFLLSDYIIQILMGESDPNISHILSILSFHGLIVFLNVPVYQTLLAYKLEKYTVKIFNSMVIINLIITTILCYYKGAVGAGIAAILTQSIVTIALVLLLELRFKQYSLLKLT